MKLEAKDLRIGNFFIEEYSKEIISVIELNEKDITFTGNFKGEWKAKPIPLTEERLIKFGFRKNKDDIRFWRKGSLKIKNTEKGFKYKYYESITYIQYVHQLQNLYFALTGEELTLKTK